MGGGGVGEGWDGGGMGVGWRRGGGEVVMEHAGPLGLY
jgi:hypothetical protein